MKLAKLPAISLFVTLALLLALPLPSLAAQECSINTFFGNATVDGVATDGANVTLTDLTNGAASLATTTSSGGLYLIESANLGVCAAVGDQIQVNASFGGSSASATVPYASQASTRVDMAMASPILSSVIVAPAAVTIPIGTIQQLTASPFDQDNNSIAANITWASNNSLVAAVNATGAVNAAASGTANITATAANGAISVTGTSAITVAAAADTTPPVLTLPGNITAEAASAAGATVTYAASANDGVDGAVPAACNPASGSTFTLGTTVVSCTASDAAANTATQTFNVTVQDTTAPAITMNGASLVGVGVGDAYIDAGATALDDVDGNLTASIITTSNVDTTVAGTYSVTYDVSDAAGNAATQQVRTVSVTEPDTTPPAITLLGNNPETVGQGAAYADAGATALDNVDGNLTAAIITTNTVNTDAEGSYTVTYNVSDAAGNTATATRTVNVVAAPVVVGRVHVNPDNVTLIVGSTFLFTAEARDAGNQLISPTPAIIWSMKNDDTTVGNIDSNGLFTAIAPGNATVIATVGNVNGTADILVNPPDTTPPVITILGANPITVQLGELYVDSGATASDNVDGDVTASIIATSTVNTAIAGTYNVTYAVRDAAGNDAAPVTRVVIVNTPPVLATIPSRISNSAVAFTASATDADGDAISYLLVSAPAGAAINQATGEFTWTPVSDGVYMFDVQASDGKTIVTTPASITADLLPPTTWDDYGEEDGVWQNSNRIITLTPEHGISGPSWTKYCLGEMCDPANGTEYTVPVNISADGTTYFRYASRDAAGNLQPARERAVKIDRNSFTDNGVVVESDKIKKVNDTSGEVELEINTTANQSISLSIRKLASAPNTSSVGIPALNKYVEITSPALQGTMNGTMIKLHYTDADVAAAGIDEATLRLYFYNETTGAWEKSPNSGVDTSNNIVWASTDHFSTWGAFGSAASSAPAPSGGGGSNIITVHTGGSSGGGGGSAAGSIVSTTKTETPSVSAPAQKAGPIEAPEAEKQANGETTPSASASPITGRAVSDTGKGRANPKAGAAIMIAIVAGGLLAAVIVKRFRKKAVR